MTDLDDVLGDDLDARLRANLAAIHGVLAAPRRGWVERALLRVGVHEPTARMMAATPVLRWSWATSVVVTMLLAANAGQQQWQGDTQLIVFLLLAPIVPLVSVALAFAPTFDRSHEVLRASPFGGMRVLLVRAVTVFFAAAVLTALAAVTAPVAGIVRLAWLLPAAATTSITLVAASRWGVPRAAAGVAAGWLAIVAVVALVVGDATAAFGVAGQVMSVVLVAISMWRLRGLERRRAEVVR